MKTITLFGEDIKIAYNIAVQIGYEKITDKAFDLSDLNKVENQMALYYSVIVANNPDTNITIEQLIHEASYEDLQLLATETNEAIAQWLHIPAPANLDNEVKEEEEEEKNA